MEDLGEDYWTSEEFEDYSKSYVDEDYSRTYGDEDYSKSCEDGKLRWIWRKGVSLGKKMVVTGVVVSSAPFVLPPLVALSAIGFAFSVPAGFVFATYACTDKLMNVLLPMPSPPPLQEMRGMSSDEEEYWVDGEDVDKGYDEEYDIDAEEKKYEEDTRKEMEMRIELAEEGDEGIKYGSGQIPINKEPDVRMSVGEIVEEGYEEDVGEYMEGEEQRLDSNVIPSILEGIREGEDEISSLQREGGEMPKDSLRAFVVEAEVGGQNEDNVEQVTEELAFESPRGMEEENVPMGSSADIEQNELRRETKGLIEKMRDESKDDLRKKDSPAFETPRNEGIGGIPIKDMSQDKGNKNLFVIPEEVKPAGFVEAKELNTTVGERRGKTDESVLMQEQKKYVPEKKLEVNVKRYGDRTTTDVRQQTGSDRETGTLVLSDADAREVAVETGFDLSGHGVSSVGVVDLNVGYQEVRIESATVMAEHVGTAPDQETTSGSEKDAPVNEVKIWEQINAVRTIVGYKTEPHSSCLEELKALYVFTGVELPASPKELDDLADINEKLQFLMSIVGVK